VSHTTSSKSLPSRRFLPGCQNQECGRLQLIRSVLSAAQSPRPIFDGIPLVVNIPTIPIIRVEVIENEKNHSYSSILLTSEARMKKNESLVASCDYIVGVRAWFPTRFFQVGCYKSPRALETPLSNDSKSIPAPGQDSRNFGIISHPHLKAHPHFTVSCTV
jgi:hypothetical protein